MALKDWNLGANEEEGQRREQRNLEGQIVEQKNLDTHWEVSLKFHTEAAAKIFAVYLKSKPIGGHKPEVKEVAD